MTYDQVKSYIKELNVTSIKIVDTNGKKLLEFVQEASPENLINKIESFLPSLKTNGRVTVLGANESQYKQHWKDCYNWQVVFNSDAVQTNTNSNPVNIGHGFISQREAELIAKNKELEQELKWNEKLKELEKKIDAANARPKESEIERMADKYGPLALSALGFKFEPDQMDTMMKMYQIQGIMNGSIKSQGMAGLNLPALTSQNNAQQPNANAQVQRTAEEQQTVNDIITELNALSEKTTDQKILQLVKGLNNNPAWVDMAINFMNNNQQSKSN